jgi:hypothetical protein
MEYTKKLNLLNGQYGSVNRRTINKMAKLKDHQWYHNTNEWTSQTPLRPVGNSNAALNAGCLFLTSDTDADYLQEDLNKLAEWEGT